VVRGVGGVEDDVCGCGFGAQEVGGVVVAEDDVDVGVGGGDGSAFFGGADERCVGVLWVRVIEGVEGVAAYVTCCSGAGREC